MTASVLKQDPKHKKFKRTLIYYNTDTQYANVPGNLPCQATKRSTNETRSEITYLFLVELLFSCPMLGRKKNNF